MANEVENIIEQKDLPVQEKVSRISKEVRDSVTPLLGVSEGRIRIACLGQASLRHLNRRNRGQTFASSSYHHRVFVDLNSYSPNHWYICRSISIRED